MWCVFIIFWCSGQFPALRVVGAEGAHRLPLVPLQLLPFFRSAPTPEAAAPLGRTTDGLRGNPVLPGTPAEQILPRFRRFHPDGAVFSGSSRRRGVKIGGSLFCGSPHPPPAANRNDCFAVGVAWVLNRSGHAVGTPLSCHGILAWGLSALGSLFLPGEPELLPSPSPSSPTGYPCGLLSPYPAPSIPLTLLLDATNGQTSCAIERITKVNSTYVEVQTFNGNTINRSRPIRTITAYIT